MRPVIKYYKEPEINDTLKQSVVLRLSKNKINGRSYDVYLVPMPVGIARQLMLPVGLALEVEYDPKKKNQILLRWDNGTTAGTE